MIAFPQSSPPRPRPLARRALLALTAGVALVAACSIETPTNQGPSSHLRVVMAIPNAPGFDLVVDSQVVVGPLGFRGMTGFMRIEAGTRRIRLFETGTTTTRMDLVMPIEFPRAYTVLATGMMNGIEPVVAPDTEAIPLPGDFKLRILQAAPSAGTVDVYITDQNMPLDTVTPMMEDLVFRGNSLYLNLPVGRWRVRLTSANTKTVLLDMTQFYAERAMRTIVVTDAAGGGQPLVGMTLVDY